MTDDNVAAIRRKELVSFQIPNEDNQWNNCIGKCGVSHSDQTVRLSNPKWFTLLVYVYELTCNRIKTPDHDASWTQRRKKRMPCSREIRYRWKITRSMIVAGGGWVETGKADGGAITHDYQKTWGGRKELDRCSSVKPINSRSSREIGSLAFHGWEEKWTLRKSFSCGCNSLTFPVRWYPGRYPLNSTIPLTHFSRKVLRVLFT